MQVLESSKQTLAGEDRRMKDQTGRSGLRDQIVPAFFISKSDELSNHAIPETFPAAYGGIGT